MNLLICSKILVTIYWSNHSWAVWNKYCYCFYGSGAWVLFDGSRIWQCYILRQASVAVAVTVAQIWFWLTYDCSFPVSLLHTKCRLRLLKHLLSLWSHACCWTSANVMSRSTPVSSLWQCTIHWVTPSHIICVFPCRVPRTQSGTQRGRNLQFRWFLFHSLS